MATATTSRAPRILNLSSIPTEDALREARLYEPVRIKVECIVQGPVNIPIRIIEDRRPELMGIDRLEDLVIHRLATKAEFRYLAKIHRIMSAL